MKVVVILCSYHCESTNYIFFYADPKTRAQIQTFPPFLYVGFVLSK